MLLFKLLNLCTYRAPVDLWQQMNSFAVTPGDPIMEKGTWHDELLILSKGTANTAAAAEGGGVSARTVYENSSFWGESLFLGLEKQRCEDERDLKIVR